jgi:heat shock protein HslJ
MHIVKFLVCLTGIAMTYVLVGCSRTSEPAPPAAAPAAAPAQATSAGTGTIADLGGPSWTLTSFDEGEPVPDGVNIYLAVDGDKVSGQGGCNRYMGSISNGDAPGTLKFGPLAMTRMACNPPADQLNSVIHRRCRMPRPSKSRTARCVSTISTAMSAALSPTDAADRASVRSPRHPCVSSRLLSSTTH